MSSKYYGGVAVLMLLIGGCSEQQTDEHVLQEKTETIKKAEAAASQLEQATTNSLKQLDE